MECLVVVSRGMGGCIGVYVSPYIYLRRNGMGVTHLRVADGQIRLASPPGQRQTDERLPLVHAPRHLLFVGLSGIVRPSISVRCQRSPLWPAIHQSHPTFPNAPTHPPTHRLLLRQPPQLRRGVRRMRGRARRLVDRVDPATAATAGFPLLGLRRLLLLLLQKPPEPLDGAPRSRMPVRVGQHGRHGRAVLIWYVG